MSDLLQTRADAGPILSRRLMATMAMIALEGLGELTPKHAAGGNYRRQRDPERFARTKKRRKMAAKSRKLNRQR